MRRFFFSILIIGSASSAKAADVLTWADCLRAAAKQNPDLISAQRNLETKRAQYNGSFNGIFPRIGLSSAYTRSSSPSTQARWTANGTASLDLFNMSRFADIQSSSAGEDQAAANLKLVSSTLLFNVRKAFADLLFAQQQLDVSRTIKEIRQRNSDLVTLRYKSGRESKGNMLRAQAELLQANADLAQAARNLKAAQQEVGHQIGQDDFRAVVGTGTLTVSETMKEPSPMWTPIVDVHPAIALQKSKLSLAQASLNQSKSALWPTLSANYVRSFQGEDYFPGNPRWTASGVVSLPLFGGGPTAAYFAVSSAKRNLDGAREDLRSAQNQVRSDLESSWANFAGAQDQVAVQNAFLEAARQRNGEADVRYASGLLSYENWEQIVTDRVNFERSLIKAQRDDVVAEAQWKKALGKGMGD